MAKIQTVYEGDFRCRTRNQNGEPIVTDVGKDHGGKGEAYSPIDLAIISLTSCILSVMSLVAKQHKIDIKGAKIDADYQMSDQLVRRIGKITMNVSLPVGIPKEKRPILEKTILMCPVNNSLSHEIEHDTKVTYAD